MKIIAGAFALLAVGLAAFPVDAVEYRNRPCHDCSANKTYDSQEVVTHTRDIDHSRVINTTTVIPVSPRRVREPAYRVKEPSYRVRERGYRTREPARPALRRYEQRYDRMSRRSGALSALASGSTGCADCAPDKSYDSQEVVKKSRDVDRSRVINTTSEVPGRTQVRETNHLVIHRNVTRHTGVVRHQHTIIEKEIRYVRKIPVETVVNVVVNKYRTVYTPGAYAVVPVAPVMQRPVRDCRGARSIRYGCRSALRVRG